MMSMEDGGEATLGETEGENEEQTLHVTLANPMGGEDMTEVFTPGLALAMSSVRGFEADGGQGMTVETLIGQKSDLWAPSQWKSSVGIFLDLDSPLQLGNTMVKLSYDKNKILSTTVPFFYFEFTQVILLPSN